MTPFRFPDELPEPISDASDAWRDAQHYRVDPDLKEALELAASLGRPLLLTGEPGSGKTTAAYWAAWAMGRKPSDPDGGIFHVQVRSGSSAASLKYEFDALRYYRDAQVYATRGAWRLDRRDYITPGPLWGAFKAEQDSVLLFDEIDKAPRDLPNDLLRELDRFEFEVPELRGEADALVSGRGEGRRLLCVMTSNGERDLPDAFLRRCLHHHIEMKAEEMREVVAHLVTSGALPGISPEADRAARVAAFAVALLEAVRDALGTEPRYRPGLAELLTWLKANLAMAPDDLGALVERAHEEGVSLGDVRFRQALLKTPDDIRELSRRDDRIHVTSPKAGRGDAPLRR